MPFPLLSQLSRNPADNVYERSAMLLPEVIERMRREKEERENSLAELWLPLPEVDYNEENRDEEEKTAGSVIVIDLL